MRNLQADELPSSDNARFTCPRKGRETSDRCSRKTGGTQLDEELNGFEYVPLTGPGASRPSRMLSAKGPNSMRSRGETHPQAVGRPPKCSEPRLESCMQQ